MADKKRNGIPEIEFMKNSKMRELDNEDIIFNQIRKRIQKKILHLKTGLKLTFRVIY